ncbi:putative TRAPP complex subunit [Rosellinia necatrix]|uniref:Trafficking protein particle complex subunit n=1 Tax=Rosellinia necatrix TaxID=77044 RepID=A0A1W2TLM3_ROSNE|nr:putative TRAPP complex subunit [Rosellinia necatrix]
MPVQVYSLYIFDRHTECIYSKQWFQPAPVPTPPTLPAAAARASDQSQQSDATNPAATTTTATATAATMATATATTAAQHPPKPRRDKGADDAKLIFGTVFSLRNMVRKLGGDDDAFISFRTAQYKLHYYETPTSLRFALITEPGALSMRNVLHQIYINLWVEYVIKNPLSPVEHKGGEGVRNEMFELGLDKFIRGLM